MSQDVNADWIQREFVESVEISLRKCINFLNQFQESASYRLSHVGQRLTSLERKLDFIEARLAHSDPAERGGTGIAFKKSVFDPEHRRELKTKAYELRSRPRVFTGRVIAPSKPSTTMIMSGPRRAVGGRTAGGGRPAAGGRPVATASATPAKVKMAPAKVEEPRVSKMVGAPPTMSMAAKDPTTVKLAPAAPVAVKPKPSPAPAAVEPKPAPAGAAAATPFPHGRPDAIDIRVIKAGTGPRPQGSSKVEIQYSVYLSDGKFLLQHQEVVALGKKQNILGLEMGCCKMTTGMKAKLWVPYKLGYGTKGVGDLIPPSADLTFDIELLRIVEM